MCTHVHSCTWVQEHTCEGQATLRYLSCLSTVSSETRPLCCGVHQHLPLSFWKLPSLCLPLLPTSRVCWDHRHLCCCIWLLCGSWGCELGLSSSWGKCFYPWKCFPNLAFYSFSWLVYTTLFQYPGIHAPKVRCPKPSELSCETSRAMKSKAWSTLKVMGSQSCTGPD